MKTTQNYYQGFSSPIPLARPTNGNGYATPMRYPGYKPAGEQQTPYGLPADSTNTIKREHSHDIYHDQSVNLGTPVAEEADGDYEYDIAGYGASQSRNDGGLSAGEYDDDASDLATIRVQNRIGNDVRMVLSNHSNVNIPIAQSVASSVTSNEFAPPTPNADTVGYGFGMGNMHNTADSPEGLKRGSNPMSNVQSSATNSPAEPSRKKQKRNKPTLSCSECVERKTKVRLRLSTAMATGPVWWPSLTCHLSATVDDRIAFLVSFFRSSRSLVSHILSRSSNFATRHKTSNRMQICPRSESP